MDRPAEGRVRPGSFDDRQSESWRSRFLIVSAGCGVGCVEGRIENVEGCVEDRVGVPRCRSEVAEGKVEIECDDRNQRGSQTGCVRPDYAR